MHLENPDSLMVYYVMLRGVDRFYAEYNTYPGEFDDQVEPDIVKLKVFTFCLQIFMYVHHLLRSKNDLIRNENIQII